MSSQAALIAAFFGPDPNPTPLSPPRVFHELPAPVVTFDGKTYTITIFRKNGTWLNNFFTEHNLSVGKAHKDEFQGRTLAPQIKGPPADDGFFYYLYAQPQNVGHPTFIWLESKEEADAVAKAIQEAEHHADEMRDAQRMALERD